MSVETTNVVTPFRPEVKDPMTNTSDGNVIPLQPSVTPEPRRKTPPKDSRAAARQAKFRSKTNGHRDAPRSVPLPPRQGVEVPPAVLSDAPPTVPVAASV